MEFPRSLFSDETRPHPTTKINYSSTFKALEAVKNVVDVKVWEHVENSTLGIIIKFMNLEFAWSSRLVHYVLSRQLYCKKLYEHCFLIGKQPACFSIFEFKDITVVGDVEKSKWFGGMFNLRPSRSTASAEEIITLCRSSVVCSSWSRDDQIRLCYLAMLTGGLLGLDRREAILHAQANLLKDLEISEQYPWGREATACSIKKKSYVCKGFVQLLQVWAYASIPFLGKKIGRPI
ncbi:hypothetical protein N665_1277s0003, partial [Sinapis alba]